MWGVAGVPLGMVGQPYLITAKIFKTINPHQLLTIYKQEVKVMLDIFPTLENYVDATYTGAVRMLKLAGFTVDGPIDLNGNPFLRFTMRA